MPLTAKGSEILHRMVQEYGKEGESIFYASRNKGTITGVDSSSLAALPDGLDERADAIIARCDGGKKGEVAHLQAQLHIHQRRLQSAIAQRDAEEISKLREQIEKIKDRIKALGS